MHNERVHFLLLATQCSDVVRFKKEHFMEFNNNLLLCYSIIVKETMKKEQSRDFCFLQHKLFLY